MAEIEASRCPTYRRELDCRCGAAPRRDAEGRVGMDGEPPAVYVVDDAASVLPSLKRLLSGLGFEVFSYLAADGLLQDPQTGRAGGGILDLKLPGLGGLRLTVHYPA